jgi:hypothetical protein
MDRVGLVVLSQVGTSIRYRRWPTHAPWGWRHTVGYRLRAVVVARPMAVMQRWWGRRDARQWRRSQMIRWSQRCHCARWHLRMCSIHVV